MELIRTRKPPKTTHRHEVVYVIRGAQYLLKVLEYFFSNAMKHKLTSAPEEWRWMWVLGTDEQTELQ